MLAIHSVWAKLLYVIIRIIWQTKLLHPCATFSGLFLTHFLCVFEFGNDIGKTLKTTSFFSVIFPRFVCAHSLLYSFPFIFSLRRASPQKSIFGNSFRRINDYSISTTVCWAESARMCANVNCIQILLLLLGKANTRNFANIAEDGIWVYSFMVRIVNCIYIARVEKMGKCVAFMCIFINKLRKRNTKKMI